MADDAAAYAPPSDDAIPECPDCGSAIGPNHVGPHHGYDCPLWAPSKESA